MIQALSINIIFMEADSGGLRFSFRYGFRQPYLKSAANIKHQQLKVLVECIKYTLLEQIWINTEHECMFLNYSIQVLRFQNADSKTVTPRYGFS